METKEILSTLDFETIKTALTAAVIIKNEGMGQVNIRDLVGSIDNGGFKHVKDNLWMFCEFTRPVNGEMDVAFCIGDNMKAIDLESDKWEDLAGKSAIKLYMYADINKYDGNITTTLFLKDDWYIICSVSEWTQDDIKYRIADVHKVMRDKETGLMKFSHGNKHEVCQVGIRPNNNMIFRYKLKPAIGILYHIDRDKFDEITSLVIKRPIIVARGRGGNQYLPGDNHSIIAKFGGSTSRGSVSSVTITKIRSYDVLTQVAIGIDGTGYRVSSQIANKLVDMVENR